MKKTNNILIAIASLMASTLLMAQEPRKLTEATISYDIVINTNNANPQASDLLDGATSVIYLKGNSSRSEMISSLGTQATIIDGKTGEVVILKNYGEQKYLITLTPDNWKQTNKKYDGIKFTYYEEYKTIIGYKCQKAIGRLADSTSFTVYFTKELIPENKEFEYINKNLPGLALQYEAIQGKRTVTYTVSNINFINPVPQSKFDIPVSGYRKMTYEESKGGRN